MTTFFSVDACQKLHLGSRSEKRMSEQLVSYYLPFFAYFFSPLLKVDDTVKEAECNRWTPILWPRLCKQGMSLGISIASLFSLILFLWNSPVDCLLLISAWKGEAEIRVWWLWFCASQVPVRTLGGSSTWLEMLPYILFPSGSVCGEDEYSRLTIFNRTFSESCGAMLWKFPTAMIFFLIYSCRVIFLDQL